MRRMLKVLGLFSILAALNVATVCVFLSAIPVRAGLTEPGPTCLQGDINGDGSRNLADALKLLNFLFQEGEEPVACAEDTPMVVHLNIQQDQTVPFEEAIEWDVLNDPSSLLNPDDASEIMLSAGTWLIWCGLRTLGAIDYVVTVDGEPYVRHFGVDWVRPQVPTLLVLSKKSTVSVVNLDFFEGDGELEADGTIKDMENQFWAVRIVE